MLDETGRSSPLSNLMLRRRHTCRSIPGLSGAAPVLLSPDDAVESRDPSQTDASGRTAQFARAYDGGNAHISRILDALT